MAGPSVTSHAFCYLRKYVSPSVSEIIPVTSERTFIGSGACDIVIECDSADKYHCALVYFKVGWCIFDFKTRYGTMINSSRIPTQTFCPLTNNAVIKLGAQDGYSAVFQFLLKLPFPTHVPEPIDIGPGTIFTLTDINKIKMIHELVKNKETETEEKDLQNFKKSKSLEKHSLFEDKLSTSGLHVNLSESKNSLPHPLRNQPEPIGIHKSSRKKFDGSKLRNYLSQLRSKINKNASECFKSAVMKSLNKSDNYSEPHPHGENEPIIISPAKLIGILSILESNCDPNNSDISKNISNRKEYESITFITVDDVQDETSDPLPKLKSIDCHQENENHPFTSGICSNSAMMKTTWNKSNNSEQYSENQKTHPVNIYPSSDEIFITDTPIYVISNRKRRSDSKISNLDKYNYGKKVARPDNFEEKNDASNSSLSNLNSYNTDTLKTLKKAYLNEDPLHVPSTSKDHGENYSMSDLREKCVASKNFVHESRNNCDLIVDLSAKIPTDSICCNIYKDSGRVCPGSKRRHEASSFNGRSPGYNLSTTSDEDEHIYGAKKCVISDISSEDDVSCSSLSSSDNLETVIQMAISDGKLSASTLPEFKSLDYNDENKPSTSGTRKECDELDNILIRSLDSKKKLPVDPFSSSNDSDSWNSSSIFLGRKRRYNTIFPKKSTFRNVEDNVEDMLRSSMEVKTPNNKISCFQSSFSLRDFKSFYLNDGNKPSTSATTEPSLALDNILVSHVTTALHEEINSERQNAASFDEAAIIDVGPHSSISEMDGLRVILQKDTFMLSFSIPKSSDYPQEILKRMLTQALKHIYEMGILDGFKNHTVPHSQHFSNRFIDIPHRSNEGYEHELTSNISPCEKVSVTNALATISGEQKDLNNVAIYSSFSAIDSLKPKIRNKLIGGKKKIPNQNSPNIQFAFSELFDHPEENGKKKECASECRSLVIGNVYESENDTVPYQKYEIQSVGIPQTCNEDFDPCASTDFVSGFEKLYVGNNEEERNPSFDNLNEAIFNMVHSPISAIDSLESGNDEKKFSKDKLDTKPMEPLQESSGSKQSVSFNSASSSFEKDEMLFRSTEIKLGKNLSCLRKESSAKNAKKGAKKPSGKMLPFVPPDFLTLEEDKGEEFYNTNGEPVGNEGDYFLNRFRLTTGGCLFLSTVSSELENFQQSSSDCTIEEQMNDGTYHVLEMPKSTPADEGYPPLISCSNTPGSQTPGCEVPLSQGTDEGLRFLPCTSQDNESQADHTTNIPVEIPSGQQSGTSDDLFIPGREKAGESSFPHSFHSHQGNIENILTASEAFAQSAVIEPSFNDLENSSAPFRQHYGIEPSQSHQSIGTHIDSHNSVSVIRRVIKNSDTNSSDKKKCIVNRKGPTSLDNIIRHGAQSNLSDSISFSDEGGKNSLEQVSKNILRDGCDSPIPSAFALSDPCVHLPVNNENNTCTTRDSMRSPVIRTSSNGSRNYIMTSSNFDAHNSVNCISKGREILDAGKSSDDDSYSKKFLDQPSTFGDLDTLFIVKTDDESAKYVAAENNVYMEESDLWEVKLQKTNLAIERTEKEIQEMKFADYKKSESEKGIKNMIHYLTCLICEETLQEAMLLSCKHMFCKLCIQQWAEKVGKCPVCKENICCLMNDVRINDFINRSYESLNSEFQRKRRALKFVREKLGESLNFLQENKNVTLIKSSNDEKVYKLDVKDQGVLLQIILCTPNRVFPDNRKLADEACNRSSSNN